MITRKNIHEPGMECPDCGKWYPAYKEKERVACIEQHRHDAWLHEQELEEIIRRTGDDPFVPGL